MMDIKITKITRPSEEKTFGNSEQLSMNRLFTMLDEPNFYIMHSKIIICTLTISNYLGLGRDGSVLQNKYKFSRHRQA